MTARRLLDLCACEGGATVGYQRAGWHVTAVDTDAAALARNPADVTVQADALAYLAEHGREYDAIHASFPCQRWTANGANPAASKYPDLITPGRELLEATGRPWVMENVPKAPLRRDLILCGTMFALRTFDMDDTELWLRRHRVFESNVPLDAPSRCYHPRGIQWAGVYGGARKDKVEARKVRKGGYVPASAAIQSRLLGGVDWMTGKGRRECIPPSASGRSAGKVVLMRRRYGRLRHRSGCPRRRQTARVGRLGQGRVGGGVRMKNCPGPFIWYPCRGGAVLLCVTCRHLTVTGNFNDEQHSGASVLTEGLAS